MPYVPGQRQPRTGNMYRQGDNKQTAPYVPQYTNDPARTVTQAPRTPTKTYTNDPARTLTREMRTPPLTAAYVDTVRAFTKETRKPVPVLTNPRDTPTQVRRPNLPGGYSPPGTVYSPPGSRPGYYVPPVGTWTPGKPGAVMPTSPVPVMPFVPLSASPVPPVSPARSVSTSPQSVAQGPPVSASAPACVQAAYEYADYLGLFANGCTVDHPVGSRSQLGLAQNIAGPYGVTARQRGSVIDFIGGGTGYSGTGYGAVDLLGTAQLTVIQMANTKTILRRFILSGYPLGVAFAAIVNAKAESNIGTHLVGDGGASVGLFQLHERGAGAGMALPRINGQPDPKDPRFDSVKNTDRIIEEVRQYGGNLMAAYKSGATVATLAGIFARDIERPANVAQRMVEREQMARNMYQAAADIDARKLGRGWLLLPGLLPWYVMLIPGMIGGLGLVATLASIGRRRGGRRRTR